MKAIIKKLGIFLILPFLLISSLSGCIGMSSKFDCNATSDGKCAPMGSINKMADYGAFQDTSAGISSTSSRYKSIQVHQNCNNPIRSNDSIQQIWIGPYEDTNGNYHEPSYIYTVIKKGRWFGESANATQD